MKSKIEDMTRGDKHPENDRSLQASSSVLSSDSSIASRVSRFKLAKEERDREEAARTRRSQASISFKQELSSSLIRRGLTSDFGHLRRTDLALAEDQTTFFADYHSNRPIQELASDRSKGTSEQKLTPR